MSFTGPTIVVKNISISFLMKYHRQTLNARDLFAQWASRANRVRTENQFVALKNLSFTVNPGEIVGLIGHNGAGKSTLLRVLSKIYFPDTGYVKIQGRASCLLTFTAGFNFNLSGYENIFISAAVLGISASEIKQKCDEIIEFSELKDFIYAPVKTYSSGMIGRLGFSIAVHIDPDVLLLDEVLSVGDASFKKKSGNMFDRFKKQKKTIVIASHDMSFIRTKCSKAMWLEHGEIRGFGNPKGVVDEYLKNQNS
jgi:ABC-type polysaccharide/polyol phosphate transport system ATPase subunit